MIRRLFSHRNASVLPIAILLLATVVGGWLNTIDLRGRILDDFTDGGIAGATLTHGSRAVTADAAGRFEFEGLPRQSKMRVDARGYLRTNVPTTQEEIRMSPLSWTIQLNEAGDPQKFVKGAQIRQGTTVLGTTNDGGNTVISPHPGRGAKILICAEGYDAKEVETKGVIATVELTPGTAACPPLPSPSPVPTPSPSPGGSPAPTPTPSPSPAAS